MFVVYMNVELLLLLTACECGSQADLCKQDDGVCFCNTRGVIGDHCTQYVSTINIVVILTVSPLNDRLVQSGE